MAFCNLLQAAIKNSNLRSANGANADAWLRCLEPAGAVAVWHHETRWDDKGGQSEVNTSKLPTFAEETPATLKLGRCFSLIKPGSLQPPRNGPGTAEDFTSSQMDDVILSGALRPCMFCVCVCV